MPPNNNGTVNSPVNRMRGKAPMPNLGKPMARGAFSNPSLWVHLSRRQ